MLTSPAAGAGEDEIDWDEDDKPTTAAAETAVAAGGIGPVDTPIAVPNQKIDVDPATTSDLKVEEPKPEAEVVKSDPVTTEAAAPEPEAPKEDFSAGLQQTDAEKEAEKRANRAKRFGIPENDEAKKLAERAKKFGTAKDDTVVKTLDSALPERRPKRGREGKDGDRAAKRQTPDRRTEQPKPKSTATAPAKKANSSARITDDPAEKAKADARAKRFGKATE